MFGYGQEILLILVLAFFVFGPSEFPKVAKVIAKALGDLRRMGDEVRSTVESHLSLPDLKEELAPGGFPVVSTLSTPPGVSNVADAPLRQAPDAPLAESGDHAGQRVPAPGATEVARSAYWAQRGSRLIHGGQCVWAARIPDSERVYFDTVERARARLRELSRLRRLNRPVAGACVAARSDLGMQAAEIARRLLTGESCATFSGGPDGSRTRVSSRYHGSGDSPRRRPA